MAGAVGGQFSDGGAAGRRRLAPRSLALAVAAIALIRLVPAAHAAATPAAAASGSADSQPGRRARFEGSKQPLPDDVARRMRQHAWREGCPVPLDELVLLRILHLGYDGAVHRGELVVHRAVGDEVLAIFRALFDSRFPIERMRLIDEYGGDDDASMADNNTSAFNCRSVAGKPGVYSKHSYGRAIDINPVANPMVLQGAFFPPAGAAFADRTKDAPGLVRPGDSVVRAFAKHGWIWGGAWRSLKDYQHFEKPGRPP